MNSNNKEATCTVSYFQVFRKMTEGRWLLTVGGHHILFGVGWAMASAIIVGAVFSVDGLRAGDSGTSALGVLFLLCGAVPLWLLLSWRVSFGSNYIVNGFWVWRRYYAMSSALPYGEIARIEFQDVNRLSSRVTISGESNADPIEITGAGLVTFHQILVFLSQRVDKSVFDEKALKLLETGEAEKYRFFG